MLRRYSTLLPAFLFRLSFFPRIQTAATVLLPAFPFQLHLGDVIETQPTIGSNVEQVTHRNIRFQVWDLGGQERLRKSWGTYYINTNAVILVVDSTDREHMPTVKAELAAITAHEDLANAVLLILANKQDAEGAMSAAEVSTALALHANKQHDWQIQVRPPRFARSPTS